jgi:hypothetical protein
MLGCVSAEPKPQVPDAPKDIRITTLWLATTLPQDSDSNGYSDLFEISMYLFAEPYPIPVLRPGKLNFKLVLADGTVVTEWNLDEAGVAAASTRLSVGPGYIFKLNLLDRTSDKLPRQQAEIVGTFTAADGTVVHQRSPTIKVGKIGV